MIRLQPENNSKVLEKLTELGATNVRVQDDSVLATIDAERAFQTIRRLKEDPGLQFSFFVDVTGADFSKYSEPQAERFSVIYVLLAPEIGVRLELSVFLKESDPIVPSISSLFAGANWAEREVYDMYGIKFSGHPSLTRLLTPDDYEGHPLRKDYPLKGKGERASFPVYSATKGHAE